MKIHQTKAKIENNNEIILRDTINLITTQFKIYAQTSSSKLIECSFIESRIFLPTKERYLFTNNEINIIILDGDLTEEQELEIKNKYVTMWEQYLKLINTFISISLALLGTLLYTFKEFISSNIIVIEKERLSYLLVTAIITATICVLSLLILRMTSGTQMDIDIQGKKEYSLVYFEKIGKTNLNYYNISNRTLTSKLFISNWFTNFWKHLSWLSSIISWGLFIAIIVFIATQIP